MPRPTWTTDEQAAWLRERMKPFYDHQADGTTRSFFNATTESFIAKWPPLDPTEAELAEHKGNHDAAMEAKRVKLRNQIEWWFRNRARANATGRSSATTAVLSLTRRRVQPLHPYQAYMHLYSTRVMETIKQNYRVYKEELPENEKPRERWSYAIAEAQRLLDAESADIKDAVEAYRQLQAQQSKPSVIDLDNLLGEGPESATKKVQELQQNIKRLARTALEACKAIEEQTGWKASVFLGGPNPETGRLATLTVHNGRTMDLQNLFSDATEEWNTIQTEWDTFIARCYKPDLAAKLEKFLRGEVDASDMPPLADPEPGDKTPTSSVPSTESAASTGSSASAAPSNPDPASTSSAAVPPQPATTTSETTMTSAARELTYEEQRMANTIRNQEILRRVLAGEQYSDIMASLSLKTTVGEDDKDKDGEEVEVPEWVTKAKEYLDSVSDEAWWSELVSAWWDFEQALNFPDGQAQSNWLSPKARPEEVKYWIARGRKYNKPPKIKSLATFTAQFREWWARLQPSERRDLEDVWPLLKNTPEDAANWSDVRRGGCNGLFMVLMCLSWWVGAAEDDEDRAELREAAEDVKWVIRVLVPAKTPTPSESTVTTTSPVPATTPPSGATTPPSGATTSPTSATSSPTSATSSPTSATSSPSTATTPPSGATSSPTTTSPTSATSSPTSATSSPTSASSTTSTATTSPVPATTTPSSASSSPSSATTTAVTASTSPSSASTTPVPGTTSPTTASTSPVTVPTSPNTVSTPSTTFTDLASMSADGEGVTAVFAANPTLAKTTSSDATAALLVNADAATGASPPAMGMKRPADSESGELDAPPAKKQLLDESGTGSTV